MIDYQRALADAIAGHGAGMPRAAGHGVGVPGAPGGGVTVPGVADTDVSRFAEIALRKRLAAVRALLPRTCAHVGRAAFDAQFRAFARGRGGVGPEGYRDEAIAFARSLGERIARREARIVAAHGPKRSLCVVRNGSRITMYARLRDGGRLRVVQFGR